MLAFAVLLLVLSSTARGGGRPPEIHFGGRFGPESASKAKVHVLAFGDSITEGMGEGTFHPYAASLQQQLDKNGLSVKVWERGLSGETVVHETREYMIGFQGMIVRLPAVLRAAEKHGVRMQWVVLLGGINDIAMGTKAADVYAAHRQLYEQCRQHGAKVLVMTVMETVQSRASYNDERSKLNALIRGAPQEYPHVRVFDLEKAMPYPAESDVEGNSLWDDGLHLTAKGYDRMGRVIYEALKPLLEGATA
ncbi:hypothetical protein HYH03_004471 [Edaphochlamys debaryana]|uniref:SGNH hydrolase-type esterase domain-containing protein n=1 Tax=Edaphochlamys debaryana TaxID=47281 RepID=A0A835YAI3_9CHLO|nr:hypothetical protein HYH03_004471 [Edaphochlamys debaryana]|eukprot:KAG2497738.1 hypothetical protein HYH03_004471 [Edaphochlamys debaryana]